MAVELRGDALELQRLLEDERLRLALTRRYVAHWLHVGWVSSTAGAAVKGVPIPRTWRRSEEELLRLRDGGTVSLDWWSKRPRWDIILYRKNQDGSRTY